LAALVGPVQNIFFLTVLISFFAIAQQAGQAAGQAAVLGRLSLSMCLWPGSSDFKGRHKLTKIKI
jgi:hypothetical protein